MKYLLASIICCAAILSAGCFSNFKNISQVMQANSSSGIIGATKRGDTTAIANLMKDDPGILNEPIAGQMVALTIVDEPRTAEWLLAHGANPNASLDQGLTPFLQQVYKQNANTEILLSMLAHGANINQGVGTSAYDRIGTNHNGDAQHEFKNPKEQKDGVTITDFRLKDESPLQYATIYGNIAYIKMLLAHGATVNAREEDGYTALHLACEVVNLEAAKTLVEHGANINAKDDDGETPLKLCMTSSSTHDKAQLLAYLREHGATE